MAGRGQHEITSPVPVTHTLALRLPDWCASPAVSLNGESVTGDVSRGICTSPAAGRRRYPYADLTHAGRRVYGNPLVRQQAGKVALQRGPLVYCPEEADNGANLHNLSLPEQSEFRVFEGKGIFAHKILIQAEGIARHADEEGTQALWQYDRARCSASPGR